jgi:hypothetical protein
MLKAEQFGEVSKIKRSLDPGLSALRVEVMGDDGSWLQSKYA